MNVYTVHRTRDSGLDAIYKNDNTLNWTAGKKKGIHKIQFAPFSFFRDYAVLLSLVCVII